MLLICLSHKSNRPRGRSGGISMGFNQSTLELEDLHILEFCLVMSLRDGRSNFRWVMVTIYGPVNHDLSGVFLDEVGTVCQNVVLPLIIGGDFNLIREISDKNSDNIDFKTDRVV